MLNKVKRITALLAVAGCVSTLFQGIDSNAAAKSILVVENNEKVEKKHIGKVSKAVDTTKAEYLGLGRLYPFVAADGTGELYYFTTSANRAYYQIKALVTEGAGFYVEIYDESGNNVVAGTELYNMEYQCFALAPEAKYFIKISGSNEAVGEIIVSEVADDHSGETDGAQEISFNKEYVVTTDCSGDLDLLKFTTSAQDVTYTLSIDSTAGVAGEYELLNEAGEKVKGFGGVTDIKNKLTVTLSLEPEKTYYLKFSSAEAYCQLLASISERINTYKLTYYLDGGTNNKENPSTYVATDTVALKNPTKKGYLFEGWFVTSDFSKAIYNIGGFGKRDYVLYAKWRKIEPETVTVTTFASKSVGKASLEFNAVSEFDGYQIRITRIGKKKNYVTYQTTKSTAVNFKNWKQGQKYYINVRAYIIDSCGNRIYGAYSKTEGITVKKKVVKKSKSKKKK